MSIGAREEAKRRRLFGAAAAAFVLGLVGGAALAEDQGLHRRFVDWIHDHTLSSGESCPWAQG